MSLKPALQPILLKTSAATDLKYSGRQLTFTGAKPINVDRIVSIKQEKYRAEVVQVVTAGAGSYTPQASTLYAYEIGDVNRVTSGGQESLLLYGYETPADVTTMGATAALQREYIHLQIIAKINANTSNYVTAATLGTGTGFTITDDAGYYPVRTAGVSNRLGATQVYSALNADGTGFTSASVSVTTAAVYSFGVGADLLAAKPIMSYMSGNLISGNFSAPKAADGTYAVAGQNYDGFRIETLELASAHSQTGQLALVPSDIIVFVDNGTGTATTNLDGFKAFERYFHKLICAYQVSPAVVQEWFDAPIVFQDPLGAAPTGTANTLGWQLSPYGSLNRTNIGAQTIVAPVLNATGLLIDQDDTATEGSHTSANQQTLGVQSFVVGKTEAMVVARVVMGDWTDAAFKVGFRKKAVYDATFNNYTDIAAIGNGSSAAGTIWINGDLIVTNAGLNGSAHVQAISAVVPVDAKSVLFVVKVAIDGTVTAFADGVSFPIYSVGTTTMDFDAGDELIPFYQSVNIGGGDPACSISAFFAIPTAQAIV